MPRNSNTNTNTTVVKRTFSTISGVETNVVSLDVPAGTKSIQITSAGIKVTAGGAPVAPIAGDDITISGEITSGQLFDLGAAGAPLLHELDLNGVTSITHQVKKLSFVAVQIQSTETWTLDVVFISD